MAPSTRLDANPNECEEQKAEFSTGAEEEEGWVGCECRDGVTVGGQIGDYGAGRLLHAAEHRLKPVLLDLRGRTVFVDEKIFSGMHFFVACRDGTCILRMRTHFTQRASENR